MGRRHLFTRISWCICTWPRTLRPRLGWLDVPDSREPVWVFSLTHSQTPDRKWSWPAETPVYLLNHVFIQGFVSLVARCYYFFASKPRCNMRRRISATDFWFVNLQPCLVSVLITPCSVPGCLLLFALFTASRSYVFNNCLVAPKAHCLPVLLLRYYIMHNPPPVWGRNWT